MIFAPILKNNTAENSGGGGEGFERMGSLANDLLI